MRNEIDNIIEELKSVQNKYESDIKRAESDGYRKAFNDGFDKGYKLGSSDCEIENIDWDSIKVFAKWCYINGIDFSYMSKCTDTVPFTERVITRFMQYMNNNAE